MPMTCANGNLVNVKYCNSCHQSR